MKQTRGKYKGILLYPDCEEHLLSLDLIKQNYKYALITHDKDVNEDGELLKPHIHVVIKLDNTQEDTALEKNLGLRSGLVHTIFSLKGSLEYLIHLNNPEKYQYSLNDVEGDLKSTLEDFLIGEIPEAERFKHLLDLLDIERPLNIYELTRMCLKYGYYDILKKNSYLLVQMIKTIK